MEESGGPSRSDDVSKRDAPGTSACRGVGSCQSDRAMPSPIFWLELAYLLLLGVLFYAYHHSADFRDDFPSVGPLPMGVLWFGALGGVMVGMSGKVGRGIQLLAYLEALHGGGRRWSRRFVVLRRHPCWQQAAAEAGPCDV